MRLSQLFTKTRKQAPADETAKNAQLLIQAGFIHKEMAGVYAYLPLGLMVIDNIKAIVRDEMNKIGGQELIMTNLQRPELWQKTDRWSDENVDVWFKTKLQNDTPIGLAWSHEEPITDMMRNYVTSYRDLPIYVYQFQTKLRNELRSKSGIMRGREFVMKDLYSYSIDQESHEAFYDSTKVAYMNVFDRVGLGDITYITYASGGAFTKEFSHEFQTITDAGEDVIYVDEAKNVAVNEEMMSDESLEGLGLNRDNLVKRKAAEVGNIFSFGTDKTATLDLNFTTESGEQQPVYLGSYGIGVTRLMGVIAEHFSDDKGLVWPESVAPAKVYLARLDATDDVVTAADELYSRLTEAKITVLYDDRDERPGQKFADADLMGIPYRVVVSNRTVTAGAHELKSRTSDQTENLSIQDIINKLVG